MVLNSIQQLAMSLLYPTELTHPSTTSTQDSQEKLFPAGINDLPFEILGEIFLICAAQVTRYDNVLLVMGQPNTAPLVLTHVCRLWRNLCLTSLPQLWTTLTVYRARLADDVFIHLVQEWLSRSQNAPLKINYSLGRKYPLPKGVEAPILSHSQRWQTLTVSHHSGFLDRFLSLPDTATPALEALIIANPPCFELDPYLPRLLDKLHTLSSITQLCIDVRGSSTAAYRAFLEEVPWERMTHVKLWGSGPGCHFPVLARCASAIEICLRVYDLWSLDGLTSFNATSTIHLPTLRSMTISARASLAPILDKLVCPSLQNLYIRRGAQDHIQIEEIIKERDALAKFLQSCPTVEQVIICISDAGLRAAQAYLEPGSLKSVANVEVRVLNCHEDFSSSDIPRCPIKDCDKAHFGWSSPIGNNHLGVIHPRSWPLATWSCSAHETDSLDWYCE